MSHNIDAIYDHGVLRPLTPLSLPEGAKVRLHIEEEHGAPPNRMPRIVSPRLVRPEEAEDFGMQVRDDRHAGL